MKILPPQHRESLALVSVSIALFAGAADARPATHFDAGLEGWLAVDYHYSHVSNPTTSGGATFDGANGQSPGSLRIADLFGETGIAAPAAFLGDQSANYGLTLEYDIYLRYTDTATYPAVILNAGSFSLYFPATNPPVNAWQHRVVPLTASAGWRLNSSTGAAATEAQVQQALSNLHGLYIYTEWHTGADDTNVDNVVLGSDDACPADFDKSGFVDTDDFTAFVLAFEAGTDDADFDRSGFVDTDDFTAFVIAFEGGC